MRPSDWRRAGQPGRAVGPDGSSSAPRAHFGWTDRQHGVWACWAAPSSAPAIGAAIGWLYKSANPRLTRVLPGGRRRAAGAGAGLAHAERPARGSGPDDLLRHAHRLNAVRSIEAIIVAMVIVVWVGIGPFAGVLALALHTHRAAASSTRSRSKALWPGRSKPSRPPGANRLQTIIYAVIPQIIPPYISYTMYRWDINVRMSTIIGFVGGGGIGFLLQQNINLLNYRTPPPKFSPSPSWSSPWTT